MTLYGRRCCAHIGGMTVKDIALMGNPVLKKRAAPVAEPGAAETRDLVVDMIDSMAAAGGVGLAAPQISVSRQVVIFFVPEDGPPDDGDEWQEAGDNDDSDNERRLTVLINPEIEILSEEQDLGWEGCLSVPGLSGLVPRHTHIRYRGLDLDGALIEREARGFHARVVQHECDHLEGILYPQRMTDISLLLFNSETRHYEEGGKNDGETS